MLLFLSFLACKEEPKPETKIPNDTQEEEEEVLTECEESLETNPTLELGSSSWFYLDPIRLTFSEQNVNLSVSATNSAGEDVPVSFEWNDSRELAEVLPDTGSWQGDESYTLRIVYCQHSAELSFSTSEFGLPFEGSSEDLVGRTYNIDLASATYTDPPGIGTLLGQNIDQPLLFGIDTAEDGKLDFIAALGIVDDFSNVEQTTGLWYFPDADFSNAPFFDAYSEFLSIEYGTITIPIYDFKISGTFSADGNQIGNAHFEGLGDTREIGPALAPTMDEYSICELLTASGANCEICPGDDSTEPFCAFLAGDLETVSIIPNLTLVEM